MRAGYVALLGVVLTYSALYQSTGPPRSASGAGNTPLPNVSTDSARILVEGIHADALPTIGGGICKLTTASPDRSPCGGCSAICPAKDLVGLVGDFFETDGRKDERFLDKHWNVPRSQQDHLQFVIASLPDPVHTHLALLFDRSIETIQRAAQASGYLFSRAWMPWDISPHVEHADFTVRLALAKYREQVESLPGLMIFRMPGADLRSTTILFVFVVGETPTGGLRLEQFQNALNIRRAMLAGATSDEQNVLRIFGPSFSGSLASLNSILDAQQPHTQFHSILVRSGTVSSFGAAHDFCEAVRREWPDLPTNTTPSARPDFASFQFSDQYVEFYLSRFFKMRQHKHSNVAILSEDETAYGNQEKPEHPVTRSDRSADNPNKPDLSSSRIPDPCGVEPKPQDVQFLRLYFPREIAQLRDAYQTTLKTEATSQGAKPPPQTGLPLSLGLTGSDDDSVSTYAPLQTPLSQESILQSIVATLRKEHAKVVVIRASDPLDVVFLSRYLRQNYPQARLVTVGIDLLMIHDFYDPRFHGILGVAAYPLLNGVRFPTLGSLSGSDRQEIQRLFSDSFSAGQFNAAESLLAPLAGQTAPRLPPADYTQLGMPSFMDTRQFNISPWRAHLWLTAIGREGYWPVAVLDDVDPQLNAQRKVPEREIPEVAAQAEFSKPYQVHFSVGWMIFWAVAMGLTVFLAFLLALPQSITRSEILARFGLTASVGHNALLFAGSLLLFAAQTLFLFPVVVWLPTYGGTIEGFGDLFTGMQAVLVCYEASAVALLIAYFIGFRARKCTVLAWVGIALSLAAMFGSVWLTYHGQAYKHCSRLAAFVYRYIEVGSGVSPCLPLLFLLAAWIWWCWQALTGVASTEEKQMLLPDDLAFEQKISEDGSSEEVVPSAFDRLRLQALCYQNNKHLWAALKTLPLGQHGKIILTAFVGIFVIYLWMRPSEIAEAFEYSTYKVIYWILLYASLFLVCYLVTHIVALWLEFRTLLRAIDRLPFRRGFTELKSLTWKPLWKLAGSGRREFLELLQGELDVLRQIRNGGVSFAPLLTAIDETTGLQEQLAAAAQLRRRDAAHAHEILGMFRKMQNHLAKTVSAALIYANARWKTEKYVPTEVDKTTSPNGTEVPIPRPPDDTRTRVVERFLCLFYVNVILVPLRRLQTLILGLAGVFVFILLSYSSYPFESRESFHVLLISIFFAISLVVGIVYGQMYRNPLLSLITNKKPGELGLDFWIRLGTFIFIPLVSLVSVQFPEINNFLFSWLQPALQSIK